MRIAFTRWRSGGLFNRPSPRKRLLPKKKTSSGFEFVSGLAAGASAMPAKWSRRVFSFRFYEGKISVSGRNGPSALVHKPPTGAFTSRLSTGRSPFPSLDITTTVSGLLCWRDSHPLEWQLASLNGVAGFAAGGSSSERKRSRPIRSFSATPHDGQRPCRMLAEDPGRTQPRAAYPGAAAQTRVVSMAAIRLGSWESARAFKGIICDDISEIAVGTLITERPPHRTERAPFGHSAPTSGI